MAHPHGLSLTLALILIGAATTAVPTAEGRGRQSKARQNSVAKDVKQAAKRQTIPTRSFPQRSLHRSISVGVRQSEGGKKLISALNSAHPKGDHLIVIKGGQSHSASYALDSGGRLWVVRPSKAGSALSGHTYERFQKDHGPASLKVAIKGMVKEASTRPAQYLPLPSESIKAFQQGGQRTLVAKRSFESIFHSKAGAGDKMLVELPALKGRSTQRLGVDYWGRIYSFKSGKPRLVDFGPGEMSKGVKKNIQTRIDSMVTRVERKLKRDGKSDLGMTFHQQPKEQRGLQVLNLRTPGYAPFNQAHWL